MLTDRTTIGNLGNVWTSATAVEWEDLFHPRPSYLHIPLSLSLSAETVRHGQSMVDRAIKQHSGVPYYSF